MTYLILAFSLFAFSSTPIDLTNDNRGVECTSEFNSTLSINETDTEIIYNGITYSDDEFLDSGILASALIETENRPKRVWALFYLINQTNKAVVITGDVIDFRESRCDDFVAYKDCHIDGLIEMTYSPTQANIVYKGLTLNIPLKHNPVFQNDGTGMIYYDDQNAAAIVDYGSQLQLVVGESELLNCSYAD